MKGSCCFLHDFFEKSFTCQFDEFQKYCVKYMVEEILITSISQKFRYWSFISKKISIILYLSFRPFSDVLIDTLCQVTHSIVNTLTIDQKTLRSDCINIIISTIKNFLSFPMYSFIPPNNKLSQDSLTYTRSQIDILSHKCFCKNGFQNSLRNSYYYKWGYG